MIPKQKEITIIYDQRERASQIISELSSIKTKDINLILKSEQLKVGDYLLGNDVVVERKTISDFETSIIDGRIFSQLNALKDIKKSSVIIEGNLNLLLNSGRLHKKALIGLLTSIGLNYRIPIFFTRNQKETALFLYVIAKREQLTNGNNIKLRYSKTKMSFSQRQLFIMESFPDVGPTLARSILKRFKTLKKIASVDVKELQKISKLGPKKSEKIKYIFERKFCE